MNKELPFINELSYFADIADVIGIFGFIFAVIGIFIAKASLMRQEIEAKRTSELDTVTNLIDIIQREYDRNEKIISDMMSKGQNCSYYLDLNNNQIRPLIVDLNKELAKLLASPFHTISCELKSKVINFLKVTV